MNKIKFDGYDSIIEVDDNDNEIRVIYDGLNIRTASIIIDLMIEIQRMHVLLREERQVNRHKINFNQAAPD